MTQPCRAAPLNEQAWVDIVSQGSTLRAVRVGWLVERLTLGQRRVCRFDVRKRISRLDGEVAWVRTAFESRLLVLRVSAGSGAILSLGGASQTQALSSDGWVVRMADASLESRQSSWIVRSQRSGTHAGVKSASGTTADRAQAVGGPERRLASCVLSKQRGPVRQDPAQCSRA